MSTIRTVPLSFVGGELSPLMSGRPDDAKYVHGAAKMSNFVAEKTGAARRRPGTEFVGTTGNHDRPSRLVRFRAKGFEALFVAFGPRAEFPATSTVPGRARFCRRGRMILHSEPWSPAVSYNPGAIVSLGGQLFECATAHLNITPPANVWRTLEYVPNKPFAPADVNVAGNTITFGTPHGLEKNEPLEFTRDGGAGTFMQTAAGDLRFAFAEPVNATTLQLMGVPNGPTLDITNAGTAAHRMHRRYETGELVSQVGQVFYCRQDRPIDGAGLGIVPTGGNQDFWYLEPSTGELELPTTLNLTDAELLAFTYSQERTTLRIASARSFIGAVEALPQGSTQGIDYLRFRWLQINLRPPIAAPGPVTATATKRGDTIAIASVANNGGALRITTVGDHNLTRGFDFVLIEGTTPTGANPASGLNDKQWGISIPSGSLNVVDPIDPETGQPVPTPPAFVTITNGTLRSVDLNTTSSNSYQVTAVDEQDRESLPSAAATVQNNLFATGAINTIAWPAVTGAVRYRVYKLATGTGLHGLIGETSATSFQDAPTVTDTPAPNVGKTPPEVDDDGLASAATNVIAPTADDLAIAPRAVTHHQNRCFFAGTDAEETDVWGSRSNTDDDFTFGRPIQATDRIRQRVKADGTIRHLVSIGASLVALTDAAEVRILPLTGQALTPTSFASNADSRVGCGAAQPVVMHNAAWFAGRGGHVYATGFQNEAGGLVTIDQCDRTEHLFDGFDIAQFAPQTAPLFIVWALRNDGRLLGLTAQPTQSVAAWHQHVAGSGGVIESVAAGGEDAEDRVYLEVRRVVAGQVRRFIERVAPMIPQAFVSTWFVDCGGRYQGAPATSVTGADHLNGATVQVFADGVYVGDRLVASGGFTIDTPASTITWGLANQSELQTLPMALAISDLGSGRTKNINRVWLRVQDSGPFKVGPFNDPDRMVVPIELQRLQPGTGYTGLVEVVPAGNWSFDAQLFVLADTPVPVTITSVTVELAVAG